MKYKDFFSADELYSNKLPGGVGDNLLPSDIDPETLKFGMDVEMEHTNDPIVALNVVADHVAENPAYYDKLRKAGLADTPKKPKVKLSPEKKQRIREIVAKGMLGMVEMMKFFELASDDEKVEFEKLLNSGDNTRAWIMVKKFLKDKGLYNK